MSFIPKITTAGLAAATAAFSNNWAFSITAIGWGTGTYTPTGAETAMAAQAAKRPIAAGSFLANTMRVSAVWSDDLASAAISEVGIYAETDDGVNPPVEVLFAIWSAVTPIGYKTLAVDFVSYYDFAVAGLPDMAITVTQDSGQSAVLAALGAHTSDEDAHPLYFRRKRRVWAGQTANAGNDYTVTIPLMAAEYFTAYEDGQCLIFKANAANSGNVQIRANALSYKQVRGKDGNQIPYNGLLAGKYYEAMYDLASDRFYLLAELNIPTGDGYNYLSNGEFNGWKNGTYFLNPADGAVLASSWVKDYHDPLDYTSLEIERIALGNFYPDTQGSDFALKIYGNLNGSPVGANVDISTPVQGSIKEHSGHTITLSFWAFSTVTNLKVTPSLTAKYGTGGGPSPDDTFWTGSPITVATAQSGYYEVTLTVPDLITGKTIGTGRDDYLRLALSIVSDDELDYLFSITNVKVEHGVRRTPIQFVNETLNRLYHGYYALLDSPSFVGTPTAPTPATLDETTKLATTAFVKNKIAAMAYRYFNFVLNGTTGTPSGGVDGLTFSNVSDILAAVPDNSTVNIAVQGVLGTWNTPLSPITRKKCNVVISFDPVSASTITTTLTGILCTLEDCNLAIRSGNNLFAQSTWDVKLDIAYTPTVATLVGLSGNGSISLSHFDTGSLHLRFGKANNYVGSILSVYPFYITSGSITAIAIKVFIGWDNTFGPGVTNQAFIAGYLPVFRSYSGMTVPSNFIGTANTSYESASFTPANGTRNTYTVGHMERITDAMLILKCTTADIGYAVGDEIYLPLGGTGSAEGNERGVYLYSERVASNMITSVSFLVTTAGISYAEKAASPAVQQLTPARWSGRIYLRDDS